MNNSTNITDVFRRTMVVICIATGAFVLMRFIAGDEPTPATAAPVAVSQPAGMMTVTIPATTIPLSNGRIYEMPEYQLSVEHTDDGWRIIDGDGEVGLCSVLPVTTADLEDCHRVGG